MKAVFRRYCSLLAAVAVVTIGFGAASGQAAASPTHVQASEGYAGTSRSVSTTLPTAAGSGHLFAVYVVWSNGTSATVTDNRGNAYLPAGAARTTWGDNYSAEVFYAKNVAGGSTTVKATFSGSVSFGIVYVHEYAGLDPASPLDAARAAKGTGTALSSGALTTTSGGDLLFGAGASVGAVSRGGTGFTVRSFAEGNITEDKVLGATPGTNAATATHGGGGWVMQGVAFKAASGGTTPPPDTTAPSVPSDLTASAPSSSRVNLAWSASTDDVGVTGYRVFRDGTQIATTSATSYTDAGLQADTSYSYAVAAFDAAGNVSARSAAANVTTPPVSPPPPGCALPGYPDASCTGVPPGTALTLVNGDVTITTPGTVIDGKDIRGCVNVRAAGVIIRNSKIACGSGIVIGSFGGAYSGTGLVIEDTEISCRSTNGTAIGDTNFTARRVDIHNCENGFDVDGPALIEDSYIHDLFTDEIAHTDGIQLTYVARDVTIRHNTIIPGADTTSAIMTRPVSVGVAAHILIEDNLLAGGAYTLYCVQEGPGIDYRVIDNHFSTLFYPRVGAYGPWTDCDDEAVVSGNVYHETGLPLQF